MLLFLLHCPHLLVLVYFVRKRQALAILEAFFILLHDDLRSPSHDAMRHDTRRYLQTLVHLTFSIDVKNNDKSIVCIDDVG